MRKIGIGFVLFAIIAVAAYLRFRHTHAPAEIVYAGNRNVTLWSTTAQVREPVATATFGDRLRVLARLGDDVQVRTDGGLTGWVNQRELLSSELWDQARELTVKAAAMPVVARGHTAVLSNIHLEPGRNTPRVDQFKKDVPVLLLERTVVPYEAPGQTAQEQEISTAASAPVRKEDWWLVLAKTPDHGTVAGWVLGHFIALDVPDPLPDYADSAGVHIVAWSESNRVPDGNGSTRPQYLVLGATGPEGQACDFSQVRVYTWSVKHQQYETAFVDGGLCGKLPLQLKSRPAAYADITFSFEDLSNGAPEQRTYHMQDTIVRRVGFSPKPKRGARAR